MDMISETPIEQGALPAPGGRLAIQIRLMAVAAVARFSPTEFSGGLMVQAAGNGKYTEPQVSKFVLLTA